MSSIGGSGGVTSVIGLVLGSWLLPGTNTIVNSMIGMMIGAALEYAFSLSRTWFTTTRAHSAISALWRFRYRLVVSCRHSADARYDNISTYLFKHFSSNLSSCSLIKQGDATNLSLLYNCTVYPNIVDTFEQHSIRVDVVYSGGRDHVNLDNCGSGGGVLSSKEQGNDYGCINTPVFVFLSQTADPRVLQRYVEHIRDCTSVQEDNVNDFELGESRRISVFVPTVVFAAVPGTSGGGGTSDVGQLTNCKWEEISFMCTKTQVNTHVHASVVRDFYDDIDHFVSRKKWYDARGLVHQRGYFLHSPPGCGKTAMIKAVAHRYRCNVFTIDLSIVRTSSALTTLAISIRDKMMYNVKPYILAFEDIDRCESLLKVDGGAESSATATASATEPGISMTTLLNILDGLIAPSSRIIVMTANDATIVERHHALVRPGRVDKTIAIPYVDDDQLQRMMRVYYPDFDVESSFHKVGTSAQHLADEVFHGGAATAAATLGGVQGPKPVYRLTIEPLLVSTMVVAQVQANPDAPLRALEALTRIVAC